MEDVQKGRRERIAAVLSNYGVCWLMNSLLILFNSLNTGPFEYSLPLSLLTTCAIYGVVVLGPRALPNWAAFQPGNRIWLMIGVIVVANFAVLLPYHPQMWFALKLQAFIVLPLFCVGVVCAFFTTKANVADHQTDEEARLLA